MSIYNIKTKKKKIKNLYIFYIKKKKTYWFNQC